MVEIYKEGCFQKSIIFPDEKKKKTQKGLSFSSFHTANVLQHEWRQHSIHLSRFELVCQLTLVFTFLQEKGYMIKLSVNKDTHTKKKKQKSNNLQTFVSITEYRKSNTPNLFVHTEYWSQIASFSSGKLLNARLLKTKNNRKEERI